MQKQVGVLISITGGLYSPNAIASAHYLLTFIIKYSLNV